MERETLDARLAYWFDQLAAAERAVEFAKSQAYEVQKQIGALVVAEMMADREWQG